MDHSSERFNRQMKAMDNAETWTRIALGVLVLASVVILAGFVAVIFKLVPDIGTGSISTADSIMGLGVSVATGAVVVACGFIIVSYIRPIHEDEDEDEKEE